MLDGTSGLVGSSERETFGLAGSQDFLESLPPPACTANSVWSGVHVMRPSVAVAVGLFAVGTTADFVLLDPEDYRSHYVEGWPG